MNYGEYFQFLDDHMLSVIVISSITLIVYLLLYRKYIFSIFDPLVFAVVATALANATVFYLYFDEQIKLDYFQRFVITELGFLAGFFLIRPLKRQPEKCQIIIDTKWYDSTLFVSSLFYWSSMLHIALQLLTYGIVGLPILMDSRLTTYAGGTGFGFVGRIVDVVGATGTILLFYRIFYKRYVGVNRLYNYVYLIFLIFFLIVSGNKTNLVFLVYYLFLLQMCMSRFMDGKVQMINRKIAKTQLWLFLISIPLIFFVIYVQYVITVGSSDNLDAFSSLLFRILSFGDIYYMTFPHEVILRMNHDNAFMQLFKDFLGTYRIVPWQQLPTDCGIEVMNYHGGNANVGPNARYNYFAMLYFGSFGQVFYCFILGLVTSFIRNTLYRNLPNRMIFIILYILVNFNLLYILQDQSYTFGHNLNILLIFPPLFGLSTITYLVVNNWKKLINQLD